MGLVVVSLSQGTVGAFVVSHFVLVFSSVVALRGFNNHSAGVDADVPGLVSWFPLFVVVVSQPGAPAVMTTVPQPVSTSMQPPVSTHTQNGKLIPPGDYLTWIISNIIYLVVPINQMRPPPGLQTITVQPEQLQSPNQRYKNHKYYQK